MSAAQDYINDAQNRMERLHRISEMYAGTERAFAAIRCIEKRKARMEPTTTGDRK